MPSAFGAPRNTTIIRHFEINDKTKAKCALYFHYVWHTADKLCTVKPAAPPVELFQACVKVIKFCRHPNK